MLIFNCLKRKAHISTVIQEHITRPAYIYVPSNDQWAVVLALSSVCVTSPTIKGYEQHLASFPGSAQPGNETKHHQYSVLVANVSCLMHDQNLEV